MNIGLVGLGKMGKAVAKRILTCGYHYTVFGFDVNKEAIEEAKNIGVEIEKDLSDLAERADIIFLMLPAGEIIDKTIDGLMPHLKDGDIIVDAGNSYYKDSIARAEKLEKHGIYFLDCGLSGGLQGQKSGFCLMVGGQEKAYKKLVLIFEAIACENGFEYLGKSGAGHYTKMVHNAIEYGLLQAYSEGFNLLANGQYADEIDLEKVANLWQNGAIVRSFILGLIGEIYQEEKVGLGFERVVGKIYGGQTGKWALQEAKEKDLQAHILQKALEIRDLSQEYGGDYSTKLVALLRNKFGGHDFDKL